MDRMAESKPPVLAEVYYPDSEEPMGETDFHAQALIWLREGLEDHFARHPRVYVASNMFLYYVEGQPARNQSPDVMVAKGVGKHRRRVFKIWEEGVVPCAAFEISSEWTWAADVGPKLREYERIRIKEYFVFDPVGDYLQPRLLGHRLSGQLYVPIASAADGSLVSQELKLRLVPEGNMLRLIDLGTNQPVLTRAEQAELHRQQAELHRQQAEQERLRADALAAEVERLRAALA
jgi:Uma2 family endonuclease